MKDKETFEELKRIYEILGEIIKRLGEVEEK